MNDEKQHIDKILLFIKKVFDKTPSDGTHDVEHSLKVLYHTEKTLQDYKVSYKKNKIIKLASLLHDVDDDKFFKNTTNAYDILKELYPNDKDFQNICVPVLDIINLVSCSKNGNQHHVGESYWMLIPRWCDRLESTGAIGIMRAWDYSIFINRPLYNENTKKFNSEKDILEYCTDDKFLNYIIQKGESQTMIDHLYDKVIHISNPNLILIDSFYLKFNFKLRYNYLINFLLHFSKKGFLDSDDYNKLYIDSKNLLNFII